MYRKHSKRGRRKVTSGHDERAGFLCKQRTLRAMSPLSAARRTRGNVLRRSRTERAERACESVDWGGGVRGQTLCAAAKGTQGVQLIAIRCHQHTQPRRTLRSRFMCIHIYNQSTGITHTSRNSPQTLSETDIWEHIVDTEIERLAKATWHQNNISCILLQWRARRLLGEPASQRLTVSQAGGGGGKKAKGREAII